MKTRLTEDEFSFIIGRSFDETHRFTNPLNPGRHSFWQERGIENATIRPLPSVRFHAAMRPL